jgi:hypothetical protein
VISVGAVVSDETVRDVIRRRWGRGVVSFVRRNTTRVDSVRVARRRRRARAVFGWNDLLIPYARQRLSHAARPACYFGKLAKPGVSLCGSPRVSTAAVPLLAKTSMLR